MYIHAHIHTAIYIDTYVCIYVRTYIYTYICTYIHIYIHSYMICTYTSNVQHAHLKKNGTPFLDLFLNQLLGKAKNKEEHVLQT